jgi:hypothetical protein
MEVIEYLKNHIKTDLAPSPIHGIGTFALRDIEIGEPIFYLWSGDTRVYTITEDEYNKLPDYVKMMIKKGYENKAEYPVIWFRLFRNLYWNLANPLAFINASEENANCDSYKRVTIKKINKGEELLGTYKLENTLI